MNNKHEDQIIENIGKERYGENNKNINWVSMACGAVSNIFTFINLESEKYGKRQQGKK